jgi:acetyl-CoA carboxylase biotin carboxyl carrier protein
MKKRNGTKTEAVEGPPAKLSARTQVGGAVDLETVRELAALTVELGLSEIEVEPSGRIRIARITGGASASPSGGAGASGGAPPSIALAPPAPVESAEKPGTIISSPFVGTFYRAPSPEAPAFVDVGQQVKKGQVVCIVEAMKLMNEIESEADGRVSEILVKNGEHVEYGQALIRLTPT